MTMTLQLREIFLRLKSIFGLYDNFGSRISVEKVSARNYIEYDCFFAYGSEDTEVHDTVRPTGTYLRASCLGGVEKSGKNLLKHLHFCKRKPNGIGGIFL